jgi:hypothetical protein
MDKPFYEFTILEDAFRFEFSSSGRKNIEKAIIIQNTDVPNFYSLMLTDIQSDGSIDVLSESNNGDMEKIMATVIQSILVFLAYHSNANIAFAGSTPSRTRLYNIILSKEFEKFGNFNIFGLKGNDFVPFVRNHLYEGFVISKKKM